jgi:hypothetical protein
MKSTLVRLGIGNFNPKLKRAAERLETLRTGSKPSVGAIRDGLGLLTWAQDSFAYETISTRRVDDTADCAADSLSNFLQII